MSRSFKKYPVCKDGESGYPGKNFANRRVRRFEGDLSSGGAYKKLFCPYDIHDQWSMNTWEEWIAREWRFYTEGRVFGWWRSAEMPDEKEEYRRWRRFYRNK